LSLFIPQDQNVRLFDRGELNSYKDDLHFIRNLWNRLSTSDVTLTTARSRDVEDVVVIESYATALDQLVTDLQDLLVKVSVGHDRVFMNQSVYFGHNVMFMRKICAVQWLLRVLELPPTTFETLVSKRKMDVNRIKCDPIYTLIVTFI